MSVWENITAYRADSDGSAEYDPDLPYKAYQPRNTTPVTTVRRVTGMLQHATDRIPMSSIGVPLLIIVVVVRMLFWLMPTREEHARRCIKRQVPRVSLLTQPALLAHAETALRALPQSIHLPIQLPMPLLEMGGEVPGLSWFQSQF